MATRSSVGTRDAEGNYRGRYVHWDGYPSGVGQTVRALIERDGVETVRRVLIEENYGWSSLDTEQGWELADHLGLNDGRFKAVRHYGVAYTDDPDVPFGPQTTKDEWITKDNGGDTEYAYVINDDGTVAALDTYNGWKPVEEEW